MEITVLHSHKDTPTEETISISS